MPNHTSYNLEFLEFLKSERIRINLYDINEFNKDENDRLLILIQTAILMLEIIIHSQSIECDVSLSTYNSYYNVYKEFLNLRINQDYKSTVSKKFKESCDQVSKLIDKSNDLDILNNYIYSQKSKKAFLVGDKINIFHMRDILLKCGFNCFTADKVEEFDDYLENNFELGDSLVDFVFYFAGFATIDNDGDLLINETKKLKEITNSLEQKEKSINEKQNENLGFLLKKEIDSSMIFKVKFRKVFIFDIFQRSFEISDIFEKTQPTFNNNKDTIYLYSSIPYIYCQFYRYPTSIFTHSLIGRIESDIIKNEGRNISSIAQIVRLSVIDKLNIFKKSGILNKPLLGEDFCVENNKVYLKSQFGSALDELTYGKLLLKYMPIIYGDASICDFSFFENKMDDIINL